MDADRSHLVQHSSRPTPAVILREPVRYAQARLRGRRICTSVGPDGRCRSLAALGVTGWGGAIRADRPSHPRTSPLPAFRRRNGRRPEWREFAFLPAARAVRLRSSSAHARMLPALAALLALAATDSTRFIRVNQVGYLPDAPKVAVLCALDSADAGLRRATFVVR